MGSLQSRETPVAQICAVDLRMNTAITKSSVFDSLFLVFSRKCGAATFEVHRVCRFVAAVHWATLIGLAVVRLMDRRLRYVEICETLTNLYFR
jgi:hypothetical protein